MGTQDENYFVYEHLADFKVMTLKRVTTKINNFQVHRIVRTKIGTGDDAQVVSNEKKTLTSSLINSAAYRAKLVYAARIGTPIYRCIFRGFRV